MLRCHLLVIVDVVHHAAVAAVVAAAAAAHQEAVDPRSLIFSQLLLLFYFDQLAATLTFAKPKKNHRSEGQLVEKTELGKKRRKGEREKMEKERLMVASWFVWLGWKKE